MCGICVHVHACVCKCVCVSLVPRPPRSAFVIRSTKSEKSWAWERAYVCVCGVEGVESGREEVEREGKAEIVVHEDKWSFMI